MALIVVIFSLGIGYVVFGRDNEKTVLGAQTITGAILNAKQCARRDGRPTGIRVLFGAGTQATQLQLIQQPEDYNAGLCTGSPAPISPNPQNLTLVTFQAGTVDFVGGGDPGNPLTWTVQPGDYFFVTGVQTPHLISSVTASPPSITLAYNLGSAVTSGTAYNIVRAPRPIPSEDLISLPSGIVIDNRWDALALCRRRSMVRAAISCSPRPAASSAGARVRTRSFSGCATRRPPPTRSGRR